MDVAAQKMRDGLQRTVDAQLVAGEGDAGRTAGRAGALGAQIGPAAAPHKGIRLLAHGVLARDRDADDISLALDAAGVKP